MPVPDRHEDEPAKEVDRDYYRLWREAKGNAVAWEAEATRLRTLLEGQVGDAYAATIDGIKVVTYRPTAGYATQSIIKDYPDLVGRFMIKDVRDVLNIDAFRRAHPEVAERYRVRSWREVTPDGE